MSWGRGRNEVAGLVEQGELDVVVASDALAERLVADAVRGAASARAIAATDPGGASMLAYDAARRAATALLAVQGLRPTVLGGHRVVQDAVIAQFDGPFRAFGRMRRRRHEQQYPGADSAPATSDDAAETIGFADDCLHAARELLESGAVGPWTG